MDCSETRMERVGFWPAFQRAKNELAASLAQDRGENQHVDDIKGQQDLHAKAEMAQAVIKKDRSNTSISTSAHLVFR